MSTDYTKPLTVHELNNRMLIPTKTLRGADTRGNVVNVADALLHDDAHRLAGCWNACAGINPDAVPDLLEVVGKVIAIGEIAYDLTDDHKQADEIAADLDEARAALEKAKSK